MYSGRVFGESQSSVRAHIEDKMITGNIVLPDETYHIEVYIEYIFLLNICVLNFCIFVFFKSHHGDIYLIYPIDTW